MALTPRINSMVSLKQYVLRKLGAPVVNIEVTDDQLNDIVNDVIEDFVTEAYSGMQEVYVPIKLTPGVYEYILPYEVFAVLELYGKNSNTMMGMGGSNVSGNPFHIKQYVASDLYASGVGKVDMLGYEMTMQQIQTLNILFQAKLDFSYNSHYKKLYILSSPIVDDEVLLHCYSKIYTHEVPTPNPKYVVGNGEPEFIDVDENNIFDIKWIKRMAVEKTRYQWAVNMMKYSGSALPNGGSLNVDGILNEAKENIEKLKEEFDTGYKLPPDFFVGSFIPPLGLVGSYEPYSIIILVILWLLWIIWGSGKINIQK